MPRQQLGGATYRRRSSDRVRSDVQFATPTVVAASVPAGTAFDTSDVESISVFLQIREYYVSALTGAQNDFSLVAREVGDTDLTIALIDPAGNDEALSVEVTGEDIVVNLATGPGGAITTTAAQLIAAINAHATAKELVVAALAAGNDGTGVVTALAAAPFVGPQGTSPTMDVTVETTVDGTNWYSLGTIPQQNAVGQYGKVFGPVGYSSRINYAVGGTATPTFALSALVIGHR